MDRINCFNFRQFKLVFLLVMTMAVFASEQVNAGPEGKEKLSAAMDRYNVAWDTPGGDATGSMPIGNGDIALNVWVENNGDLLFYIAKNNAWSGDLTAPNYGGYGLIKIGRVRVSLSPNPFAASQGFRQMLRLYDGSFKVSTASGGKKSELVLWVDANRPVIHLEASCAEPVTMKASLESWRRVPTEYLGADSILSGMKATVAWYYKGLNRDVPYLVDRISGASMMGEGLVNRNDLTLESVSAQKSHHLAVHPLTAQCPTGQEWLQVLNRQILATNGTPLKKAWKEHRDWWAAFWDRSHIFITSGAKAMEVTQGYLLQRFKNACTSRGECPVKFNGSLFTIENPEPVIIKDRTGAKPDKIVPVTADYRAWGFRYWFQNTRPIYWPMMASGDFDLMRPFFHMYSSVLRDNARQVRQLYGHDGAYILEGEAFWGDKMPKVLADTPPYYGTHYYTPVLELSAMMLDYYAYTRDEVFAKETLLPVATAGVTFFDQHFQRDPKGKLLLDPDNAIETYWKVRNPLPDIAGLRYVLQRLLKLPAYLADSTSRKNWLRLLAEIPPVPTGVREGRSRLLPFEDGQEAVVKNIENPELYAIYPFRLYGLGKPGIEVAKNAFEARKFKQEGCWSQEAVQAALLGDAATAQKYVTSHLTRKDPRLRFPAFWVRGNDYVPDEDNGGNGLHALQTMLLQQDDSKLILLPAWPAIWEADFKLRAPMQTTIEGIVRNGKVVQLKVTPSGRRKDITVLPPK